MTRSAFKGVNNLLSLGLPTAGAAPTATYTAGTTIGGLQVMTIANEPVTMLYVPSARTSDLHKTKSSERIKFLGGFETGDTFEIDEAIMGSLDILLCRNTANEAYYDPAIDVLMQAAITSNYNLYLKMERYVGFDTVLGKHIYHVKSAVIKVRSDNNTVNAETKAVQQQFTLEGSGEWIEGYVAK